jgi:prepilin-type N-terminal cleavage/methylation domain-containing protein
MIRSIGRSYTSRNWRFAIPGGRDTGYTLLEVVLAIAIVGVAMLIVLSAVSENMSGIRVLKSLDERITLAQQVIEEIESGIAAEGRIPNKFSSMVAPEVFSSAVDYSYYVAVSDVIGDVGAIADLKRIEVSVFRTSDGQGSSLKLCTIVRTSAT